MKNEQQPLVAIRSLVYNHEPFLRKYFEGIVSQQTNFPYVVIVHDDCSTDGSRRIIEEFASKYPDIVKPMYETENQYRKGPGVLSRIVEGKTHATGAKYIALCEGDDYWTDPLKLQKQVDFMESHPDYSVCFARCQHLNIKTGALCDDHCAKLFPEMDEGVDVDLKIFFDHWCTQPLTMLYRSEMFDKDACNRYLHYRDTYQIYHLLRNGRGYIMNFICGIRTIHDGGVSSSQDTDFKSAIFEMNSANELYDKNREYYARYYWCKTTIWALGVYRKEKCPKEYRRLVWFGLTHFPIDMFRILGTELKRRIKN